MDTQAQSDSSLVELETLIRRHREAVEVDDVNWAHLGEIGDHPDLIAVQIVKVEIGKLLIGSNDDGTNEYKFLYAYNEEDIEQRIKKHQDTGLALCGKREDRQETIRKGYDRLYRAKLAEYRDLVAHRQAIRERVGYTAAVEVANTSAEAVKAIEAEILAFVPGSHPAAVRLAEWVVGACDDQPTFTSYLGFEEDAPLIVLQNITRWGAAETGRVLA